MAKQKMIPGPNTKLTVILPAKQIGDLDQFAVDHQKATGQPLTRAYLIHRALETVDWTKLAKIFAAEARA